MWKRRPDFYEANWNRCNEMADLEAVQQQIPDSNREELIRVGQAEIAAMQAKIADAEATPRQVQAGPIIRGIRFFGLGISLDDFLAQSQLPVREGDRLTQSLAEATLAAVKKFDEHLRVLAEPVDSTGVEIDISALGAEASGRGRSGRAGGGIGAGIGAGVGRGLFPDAANSTGPGISAPVPTYQVPPEYTDEAKKAMLQGTVLLSVLVDEAGRVAQAYVVRALGMGLDQKAMKAVWQWRFKPGMKNGEPVQVRASIEMNFRLPE
jgi:TonB family protein